MKEMLVTKYIEYLSTRKGASPFTVRNYNHYLQEFTGWCNDPVNITVERIDDFQKYLDNERHLAVKTQAYYLLALRSFYKFCETYEFSKFNYRKIEIPKYRKDDKITFLNREEVQSLLDVIKPETLIDCRNKSILHMLWSTGIRVGELCRLNCLDVDYQSRQFRILGKGNKTRVVFLTEEASKWAWEYNKRRKDYCTPMYVNYRNARHKEERDEQRRLSEVAVQKIIREAAQKAGINKPVTCHTLRHSFATNLLKNGADIRSVQLLLGHSSITSTQIYLHFTDNELQRVHGKFL